jgi:hypothetical protein
MKRPSLVVLLSLGCLLYPVAGRGVWSIPRKKSSSLSSSSPEVARTDSDHTLFQQQETETFRSFLDQSFDLAEAYVQSSEFLSIDFIQIFDTTYERYSQLRQDEEREEKKGDEESEQSDEGENDDEVRDEIRGYLRSFPPEALQEKAMELIQNGREASEVIVSLLQNPKKLLEMVETTLTPEMFSPFKQLLSTAGLKDLKEFAIENFHLKGEEIDQLVLPFADLFSDLETFLERKESKGEAVGEGGGGGFDWLKGAKKGEGQSEGETTAEAEAEEISPDSVQDILQMFHDPKQVPELVLVLPSLDTCLQIEEFRQMIIRNPQLAKDMLGIDETILARSEAFAEYMNLFATGTCPLTSLLSLLTSLPLSFPRFLLTYLSHCFLTLLSLSSLSIPFTL